jgi:hypothetical protein
MRYLMILFSICLLTSCFNKSNRDYREEDSTMTEDTINKAKVDKDDNIKSDKNVKIETWSDLKKHAHDNSINEFYLRDYNISNLICLDSTKFGDAIKEVYSLKSSYLISVKENIGKYYPCVIYGQQYDCDEISNFLALLLIDSTFTGQGQIEFISGFGDDMEEQWDYHGLVKDSLLIIKRTDDFECVDLEGNKINGISYLEIESKLILEDEGEIKQVAIDTIAKRYCKQQ